MRDCLNGSLVRECLGAQHLTRDTVKSHNSHIAKVLFEMSDDQIGVIADGSYTYCDKSNDNEFQRKSYSVQKKQHLLKPFVLCTLNGYVIDVYGF